jgi:hypothetical protein
VGSVILAPQAVGQNGHTTHDRDIGYIEDRPETDVDEIDNVPIAQSVQQVANGPAQLQPQTESDQPPPRWQIPIVEYNGKRYGHSDQDEEIALIGKNTKRRTTICDMRDAKYTP